MDQTEFERRLKHRLSEVPIKLTDRMREGKKEYPEEGDVVKLRYGRYDLAVRVDEVEREHDRLRGKLLNVADLTEPSPDPDEVTWYSDFNITDQLEFRIWHVWEVAE